MIIVVRKCGGGAQSSIIRRRQKQQAGKGYSLLSTMRRPRDPKQHILRNMSRIVGCLTLWCGVLALDSLCLPGADASAAYAAPATSPYRDGRGGDRMAAEQQTSWL